jgi:hypothetical protein
VRLLIFGGLKTQQNADFEGHPRVLSTRTVEMFTIQSSQLSIAGGIRFCGLCGLLTADRQVVEGARCR